MGDRTRQGGVLPRVRGGGKDGGVDAETKLAALKLLLVFLGKQHAEDDVGPDPEVLALLRAGVDDRAFCAATGASVAEAVAKLAPIAL